VQDSGGVADEDALSPLVMQGSLTAEEEAELMNRYRYTGATTNIHPLLSCMVNYAQPVKFQGFDVAEGNVEFQSVAVKEAVNVVIHATLSCG
jgi:hypothetical protein